MKEMCAREIKIPSMCKTERVCVCECECERGREERREEKCLLPGRWKRREY